MLIVCPKCGTSYMVDPAALGSGGRTVRCARCKTTWFAGWQKAPAPDVSAFVDGAIPEAQAQSSTAAAEPAPPEPSAASAPPAADDFGSEPAEPTTAEPEVASPPTDAGEHDADAPAEMEEEAPSLVPPLEHQPLPGAEAVENDDVESYAARRQRMQARRKQARRSSRWTAVVLVLFAVNVALIGALNEVVRHLPQTASVFAAIGLPVNLRHLTFENVRISKELQDGVNILIVDGTIVSTADKPVAVPRLRFAARDAAGQEVYVWTALPSRSIFGPRRAPRIPQPAGLAPGRGEKLASALFQRAGCPGLRSEMSDG